MGQKKTQKSKTNKLWPRTEWNSGKLMPPALLMWQRINKGINDANYKIYIKLQHWSMFPRVQDKIKHLKATESQSDCFQTSWLIIYFTFKYNWILQVLPQAKVILNNLCLISL